MLDTLLSSPFCPFNDLQTYAMEAVEMGNRLGVRVIWYLRLACDRSYLLLDIPQEL